jgi:hypothetical protein
MKAMDRLERDRHVLNSLQGLRRQLQIVHAGIVVCAAALRYQNVDRDAEVARVLTTLVAGRLFEQIERIAELRAILRKLRTHAAGDD